MKKFITTLLALTMVLGLAACGKGGSGSSAVQSGEGEKITITIGLPQKSNVTDFENNYFTQWLEENSGYELEFMHFSSNNGEAKTQLTTMIAGGEPLPDIIYGVTLNTDERLMYGQEKYIIDLRPYMEDKTLTADYRARLEELYGEEYYDDMMRALVSADGGLYGFPSAVQSESDLPMNMMYINKTWLDRLGLEMPRTWDELVNVLRAFRDGDPNGNGKPDEVPMLGANLQRCRVGNWLMNNFERVHDQYYFNVDENGKVWLPYTSDNYRKGLQAIRELVKEGLLSELSWSIAEASEVKSMWSPVDGTPIVGVMAAHMASHMSTNSEIMYEYEPLLPLEGSYAPIMTTLPGTSCYITTESKYPEECFKLLLLISTEDGSMAMRYGKEGVDWEWVKEYGKDTVAVHSINPDAFSGTTNSTWSVASAFCLRYSQNTKYHTAVANAPDQMTWAEVRSEKYYRYAADYLEHNAATDPAGSVNWTTTYNAEETEEMGNIMTDIYPYVRNSMALFAVGDLDIYDDGDWNTYVKNIKDMGIATWEKCGQQSYDRFMGN
ncbi:MAG: extracellular solute-binding protein [Oscillospiraceae bacterium]|nr:extracellular solute-binding protein [Oscillospiraceae bacterium]